LSSLSSTDFLSPRASDFRSVGPNADVTGRTSGRWKSNTCKSRSN
jgi:hypothetical protein